SDVRDRTPALERQPNAAIQQLLWVLPWSGHNAENLLSPGQHPGSKDPAKPGPAQPVMCGGPLWGPMCGPTGGPLCGPVRTGPLTPARTCRTIAVSVARLSVRQGGEGS